jgi:hypothetical protein
MEKHTKKNTARNRTVPALLLALSAALVLAGCFIPLDPVDPAAQAGAGYLSVSIDGQGGGARTLYPSAAFTKYELTFESEGQSYGPKTLTDGKSSEVFTDIPAGTWNITAKGYVTINGTEYAAAEGSETVNITAGQSRSVSIEISAEQGGDPGYFYYNVSFPAGKVDTAMLTLSQYISGNFTSVAEPVNLKTSPSGYVDSGTAGSGLAPGYYRVDITLQSEYQRAGVSEVVHIYSNMETKAEYAYTEADFVDLVTLSGTVNLDGEALSSGWIYAYERQANGGDLSLGDVSVTDGSWTLKIPSVSESAEIYFSVSGMDIWVDNIPGITLNPGETARSGIALNLITLSGTITATADGEAPSQVYISAWNEDNQIGSTSIDPYSEGASWSMVVPAFSVETTITFNVELYSSLYIRQVSNLSPTPVHSSAVPGISLNAVYSSVVLSGTIGTVTVNGESYSDNIKIEARNQNGNYLGYTSQISESGAWSISISPANTTLASTTSISFRVTVYVGGSYWDQDIPGATKPYTGKSISGIALGDVSFATITLSGTIGAVTVNSKPYSGYIQIEATNQNGDYLGYPSLDSESGLWSMNISSTNTALASTTSISFQVSIYADESDFSMRWDIPDAAAYTGKSISGIELGDVNFTTVTLSGTIGTVTVDGDTPSYFSIQAATQDGMILGSTASSYIEDGEWSIMVMTQGLENGDEISLMLYADSVAKLLTTHTYEGSDIPGIEWGNVAVTSRTINGTVANLPEGDMAYILAFKEAPSLEDEASFSYLIGQGLIDNDNVWSLKVSSDAPASLWFVVIVYKYEAGSARTFVTNRAYSAASVALNINEMTEMPTEQAESQGAD